MKNLKIGITLGLRSNTESIWTNGIKQNVLMFIHLLKQSKNNYDVCILNIFDVDFSEKKPTYLKDVDVFNFKEKFMDMDLIIMMGSQVHNQYINKFKEDKNKKFIGYKCGNNYVIHMENVLFKENKDQYFEYETTFDELWYIPQQDETNKGFFSTLYRTEAFIVPFIWHDKFLKESVIDIEDGFKNGRYKKGYKYNSQKEKKVIGIMEPNINIVKYGLIPSMIAEESFRSEIGKNHIQKLMITNGEKLKTNHEFLSIIKTFDLYKEGKITAESRFQTAFVLTQYFDILISHQILNPLNYLYLDAVYLGYPVLHNATLCKDLGYYYENSDTKEGAKMLNYILTEHDNNIQEYHERNDLVLQRYHADNENLIETYDKLIYNLFNGGNKNLIYNPNTNRYDNL
tara:strand:- start:96 stop:1295 length:1200 start_codon:yes stop_codon:yes gene_type:complete